MLQVASGTLQIYWFGFAWLLVGSKNGKRKPAWISWDMLTMLKYLGALWFKHRNCSIHLFLRNRPCGLSKHQTRWVQKFFELSTSQTELWWESCTYFTNVALPPKLATATKTYRWCKCSDLRYPPTNIPNHLPKIKGWPDPFYAKQQHTQNIRWGPPSKLVNPLPGPQAIDPHL
jgi:hypothetical protein